MQALVFKKATLTFLGELFVNIVEQAHSESSLCSKHVETIFKNHNRIQNQEEQFLDQDWRGVGFSDPDFKTCPRKGLYLAHGRRPEPHSSLKLALGPSGLEQDHSWAVMGSSPLAWEGNGGRYENRAQNCATHTDKIGV